MTTIGVQLIPGGSLTLSKGVGQWLGHTVPRTVKRGRGAYLWDETGCRYLDLCGAHGPILLGYGWPSVDDAIRRQLNDGVTFTLKHGLEREAAERVCAMVPGAEQARFMKSGSDACSVAVRLARIHTGRDRVVSSGYHGWHDWTLSTAVWTDGIPGPVRSLTSGVALDAVERAMDDDVACVIVDGAQVADGERLRDIIDVAHDHGALMILDEVVTGFRLAPGGAQELYGVQADLACFGKALGNGMPVSTVTGPERIMRDILWASSTHWGETLSLAAACATLDVIATEPVHEHLWRVGVRLRDGIRRLVRRHDLDDWVRIDDLAPRTIMTVREPLTDGWLRAKSVVQQELARRGVLWNGVNFVTYSHTAADIDMALEAFDETFAILAAALPDGLDCVLDGPAIRPPFQ